MSGNIKRKPWVDSLRALALLMVVFGHCARGEYNLFAFTNPVKMPLFFAISGYLLSIEGKTFKKNVLKLWQRIIVPWLLLGSVILIPICIMKGNWGVHFFNLIVGYDIWWFLPCFVFGEMIYFTIRNTIPTSSLQLYVSLILSFVGLMLAKYNVLDILSINTALISQFFFAIGGTIKCNEDFLKRIRICIPTITLVLYFAFCMIGIHYYPDKVIDVHLNKYFDIPFNGICILIGLFALFSIFARIKTFPTWLVYIGKNTLVIYMLHNWIIVLLKEIIVIINVDFNKWVTYAILTITSLVICCVVCACINKYFPFLAGNYKKVNFLDN